MIEKDRQHAWFAGDPTRSDLATFNRCLNAGTERAYHEAMRLWRGEPLANLEIGEPMFDDWIADFRAETINLILKTLSQRLAATHERDAAPSFQMALCGLIAHLEPSDTEGNERLVRLLLRDGHFAAAARQLRTYTRALAELDLSPPRELIQMVSEHGGQAIAPESVPVVETARPEAVQVSDRPTVALIRPHGARPLQDLYSFAHASVVHQITKFRTMRCFERDDAGGAAAASRGLRTRFALTDSVDHDYRLDLWDEPKAGSMYLRCLNVRRQDTISSVRIGYDALADRDVAETMIASAINSLEQDIVADVSPDTDTPFNRWLEAYGLLTQWSHSSDRLALGILEELAADDRGRRLSLVHSSISSILMIRRLMVPASDEVVEADHERARECAMRAIAIDALEPFNHVILGWMRMQSRDHDRAIVAFDDAMRLNPYSSRTVIAAAEAHAYCGELDTAQCLADRALALSGRYTPSYFFTYLANIAYLRGDLGLCVDLLRRAPDNIHSALILVAAQQERADTRAVSTARVQFERALRRTEPRAATDGATLSQWIVSSNMNRDPSVRRRLFSSLERAGVAVGSSAG